MYPLFLVVLIALIIGRFWQPCPFEGDSSRVSTATLGFDGQSIVATGLEECAEIVSVGTPVSSDRGDDLLTTETADSSERDGFSHSRAVYARKLECIPCGVKMKQVISVESLSVGC